MTVRRAEPRDASELVRLRISMFTTMGINAANEGGWWEACETRFRVGLGPGGNLVGAVIDAPDGVGLAATGIAELQERIPGPRSPRARVAYVSSMSTDERWRRRGYARLIIGFLLTQVRAEGVERVELHASSEGEPLYRSIGFNNRPGAPEMQMRLD